MNDSLKDDELVSVPDDYYEQGYNIDLEPQLQSLIDEVIEHRESGELPKAFLIENLLKTLWEKLKFKLGDSCQIQHLVLFKADASGNYVRLFSEGLNIDHYPSFNLSYNEPILEKYLDQGKAVFISTNPWGNKLMKGLYPKEDQIEIDRAFFFPIMKNNSLIGVFHLTCNVDDDSISPTNLTELVYHTCAPLFKE